MKSARYEEKLKKRWRGNAPPEDNTSSKEKKPDTEITLSPFSPIFKTPIDIADLNSSPPEKNLVKETSTFVNETINPNEIINRDSINPTDKSKLASIDTLTTNINTKQPEKSTETNSFEYTAIAKEVLEAQITGKSPPPVSNLLNPRYAIRNQERRRPGGDVLLPKAIGENDSFSLSNNSSKVFYNRSLASSNSLSFLNLSFNSLNNSLSSGTLKFRDNQTEDSISRARNFLDPLKNNKAVNSTSVSSGFETIDLNPLDLNPSDPINSGVSLPFLSNPTKASIISAHEEQNDYSREDEHDHPSNEFVSPKRNNVINKGAKSKNVSISNEENRKSDNNSNYIEDSDHDPMSNTSKDSAKKTTHNLTSKADKRKVSSSELFKNDLSSIPNKNVNSDTLVESENSSPLTEPPSDKKKSTIRKRKVSFRESAKKSKKTMNDDTDTSLKNGVGSLQNNKVTRLKKNSGSFSEVTSKLPVTKQVSQEPENSDFSKEQLVLSSDTTIELQNKSNKKETDKIQQISKKVKIPLPSKPRTNSTSTTAVRDPSKFKITVSKSSSQKTTVPVADDSFSSAHALTPAVPRVRVKTLPRKSLKDSKNKESKFTTSLNLVPESNLDTFEDIIMPDISPVLKKPKNYNANKQLKKNRRSDQDTAIGSKQSQLSHPYESNKKRAGASNNDASAMDVVSHELLSHVDSFRDDLVEIKPRFAPLLKEFRSSLESNLNKIDDHFCHRAQLHRKLINQREKQNNLRESLLEYRGRTHNLEAELRKEKELFEKEQLKQQQLESAHGFLYNLDKLKQMGSKPQKSKRDSKSTSKDSRLIWLGLLADLAIVRSRLGLDPLPIESSDILDPTQTQALRSHLKEINRKLKDKAL